MTTRAPGLTAAMRRALENPGAASRRMREKLFALGLLTEVHFFTTSRTPRGQAALAAPRMTAAELYSLEAVERSGICFAHKGLSKFWITREYVGGPWKLTPTGLTALNNMRATMGSAEYREDLK